MINDCIYTAYKCAFYTVWFLYSISADMRDIRTFAWCYTTRTLSWHAVGAVWFLIYDAETPAVSGINSYLIHFTLNIYTICTLHVYRPHFDALLIQDLRIHFAYYVMRGFCTILLLISDTCCVHVYALIEGCDWPRITYVGCMSRGRKWYI